MSESLRVLTPRQASGHGASKLALLPVMVILDIGDTDGRERLGRLYFDTKQGHCHQRIQKCSAVGGAQPRVVVWQTILFSAARAFHMAGLTARIRTSAWGVHY